ncbi:DUF4136 domain-containing protein [Sphingobacteriaceae bacterium WQ 2009]|uniref:DUF4136 domain-containing protein n=1 Tax=Rhinopithecimicrobium faecis TaxID=2820698 RepID=A0A8T4HAK1_9SPHI|nr:DUF4136 domain-containing protein [Sphingobacteriaceae bacterium WQ 2009]
MKKILFFFLIGIFVASCSSQQYNTTRVQKLDFSQFKTYGWLPPVDSLSKSYFDNNIAQTNIMESANQELAGRNLQYSKDNPDILFRYIAIVNNKSRLIYGNYGWGGGYWGGLRGFYNPWYGGWGGWGGGYSNPIGRERFRYGHIIIEAIDRKSNKVVWQARGSAEIKNPEKSINKLPTVVKKIIAQYPIQAKK